MRGLDRRLRVVEVRRFGSERVAQILRRIKAMSDQELIEHILAEESGIDPRDLTDAELASLIAEFRAGEAEEEADLTTSPQ
jgi:formylmethanofuran dehydrogenase subunit B